MKKVKLDTKMLCMIGLMAALVFVGTSMRIKIPVGGSSTMLHMGNVFGILGGLLFGGIPGGLAAGIGSAIFDLTSEYASEAWITFINKFAMGFAAGFLAEVLAKIPTKRANNNTITSKANLIIAAIGGSAVYIALYMLKTFVEQRFIMMLPMEGVWVIMLTKLGVSVSNGITAVIASVIICIALKPALTKAHILHS